MTQATLYTNHSLHVHSLNYLQLAVTSCHCFVYAAHVALPDFAAGAMENWGLCMYREVALLYDNKTSTIRIKEFVARVVSHELAHMVRE